MATLSIESGQLQKIRCPGFESDPTHPGKEVACKTLITEKELV